MTFTINFKKLALLLTLTTLGVVGCDKSSSSSTNKAVSASTTTPSQNTSEYGHNLPANAPTYTMLVDANYLPFAFKDKNGLPTGFDIDIIQAVGEKQGFKVNIINKPWDTLFNDLVVGNGDIIGSGIATSTERQQKYNLTSSYIVSGNSFASLSSTNITSFNDLKDKKIGIVQDSSWREYLKQFENGNSQNITEYPTSFLMFKDLLNGKVDVIYEDTNILTYYTNEIAKPNNKNITILTAPKTPEQQKEDEIVFVIRKGNDELTKKINTGIAQIKADGTYDKIYKKWFGETKNRTTSATASTPT